MCGVQLVEIRYILEESTGILGNKIMLHCGSVVQPSGCNLSRMNAQAEVPYVEILNIHALRLHGYRSLSTSKPSIRTPPLYNNSPRYIISRLHAPTM